MITIMIGGVASTAVSFVLSFLAIKVHKSLRQRPTTTGFRKWLHESGGTLVVISAVLAYFSAHLVSQSTPTTPGLAVLALAVVFGGIGAASGTDLYPSSGPRRLRRWVTLIVIPAAALVFAVAMLTMKNARGLPLAHTSISFTRDVGPVLWSGTVLAFIAAVALIVVLTSAVTIGIGSATRVDGLIPGAAVAAIGSYVLIGFWQFNQICHSSTNSAAAVPAPECYSVANPLDLATTAACMAGALLGFLWWNTHPAQIHFGHDGAFAVGGTLSALAALSHTELLLVLLAAPLALWPVLRRVIGSVSNGSEPTLSARRGDNLSDINLIVRYWIVAILFVTAGISTFYLEWVLLSQAA
ncbi:hypothetical protein [Lacisediminihabitans sp.]|uniref:hypothetical protein n=1 Tax=Lacisediminihabitans sp. TaxID=2787631 RepID=UPI00374CCFB4